MIRILLVEDIVMMRDALTKSINAANDMTIVETLASASKSEDICRFYSPDLALMDICTAGNESGIEAAARIKTRFPNIKVILMTAFTDMTFERRAREAGADSFIYKDIGTDELLEIIRRTMVGDSIYPDAPRDLRFEETLAPLTDRETEVLRLLCKGKTNEEIAEELLISENTVVTHINNLRMKTGITKKAKLIAYAVAQGYIVPGI